MSNLIPRYSVGSKRPSGWPVLRTTEKQTTVKVYRSETFAYAVAKVLNDSAAQEVHR